MASAKRFYGKRTQHRFLSDVLNQIQDDDPESADVVTIGQQVDNTVTWTMKTTRF